MTNAPLSNATSILFDPIMKFSNPHRLLDKGKQRKRSFPPPLLNLSLLLLMLLFFSPRRANGERGKVWLGLEQSRVNWEEFSLGCSSLSLAILLFFSPSFLTLFCAELTATNPFSGFYHLLTLLLPLGTSSSPLSFFSFLQFWHSKPSINESAQIVLSRGTCDCEGDVHSPSHHTQ